MPALSLCSATDHRESLQHLLQHSAQDLATLLAAETKKFMARKPYNDQVGVALFTLAIAQGNQEAWICLYEQYKPLVLSWIMRSPKTAKIIASDGDTTPLVNSVFAKFWSALSPAKIERFESLAAILKYLQSCTYSVVSDYARQDRASSNESTLEEIEQEAAADDPADDVLAIMQAKQFWQLIEEVIPSEGERWLLLQTYVRGLKPSEICQHAPNIFPTVDDVYRTKRNVLERLRRNRRLQQAFLEHYS